MAMAENGGRLGGLGGSLKVANVQALAAAAADDPNMQTRDRILNRYIRPEMDVDGLVRVDDDDDDRIPVVDLQRLVDPNSSQEEAARLKFACEDWGFFQLVNHGVSEELMERVKADVEGFFRLPLEAKEECAQLPGGLEGYGQAFVVSEEQKLDWGDMLFLLSQPQSYKTLKFWPTSPPTFRQMLTNGKYKSIEHRVIVDPSKERLSIAAFHNPRLGSIVGPLPELVDGSKEYYKSLSMEDFMKLLASSKLDGKGLVDRLKLNP
ncbi:S-norcoclaurine synthase 1-like [Iris pallida]|uniref:S-norcoclaurine synthase 1-like n=1 Tax=Iris pallida TaxID=29817 RepID=A0AAX6G7E8_IRIPA|nr:S-norcoclaurine synthase 1-like [Iris pallida]